MKVKIKKLLSFVKIPEYAKEGDAGMDLRTIGITAQTDTYIEYGTGLAIEIPEGYVGLIFPRSSISKTDLILSNSVGVIDSGYRGEIKCRFKIFSEDNFELYDIGDKIAQLIIIPYPKIEFEEVFELSSTERSEGGFGSSGR
jgi:dUTP pyrophosphatase